MDDHHLRNRIGIPALMLVVLIGGIGIVLFSVSRVLLTLPSGGSVLIALLIAAFVLLVASTLGQNRQVSGRALGVALVVGILGLVGAGVAAYQAGPREIHAEEGGAAEGEGGTAEGEGASGGEGSGATAGDLPEDALVWVAQDIEYAEAPQTAPAGEVTIALRNESSVQHDVTIEELDVQLEAPAGETVSETLQVEPGTYRYYCSVPGHESSMNGEITFE